MVLCLFFTACQANSRIYINHTEGPYSIADDTSSSKTNSSLTAAALKKSAMVSAYPNNTWSDNGSATVPTRPSSAWMAETPTGTTQFTNKYIEKLA